MCVQLCDSENSWAIGQGGVLRRERVHMPRYILLPLCWIVLWIIGDMFIELHPHGPMFMMSPLLAPIGIYYLIVGGDEATSFNSVAPVIFCGVVFWIVLFMLFIVPFRNQKSKDRLRRRRN